MVGWHLLLASWGSLPWVGRGAGKALRQVIGSLHIPNRSIHVCWLGLLRRMLLPDLPASCQTFTWVFHVAHGTDQPGGVERVERRRRRSMMLAVLPGAENRRFRSEEGTPLTFDIAPAYGPWLCVWDGFEVPIHVLWLWDLG